MTLQTLERTRGGDFSLGLQMSDELKRSLFCNDMDEGRRASCSSAPATSARRRSPRPSARVGIPPALPKTYVRLRRDQALSPADQDAADRAPARPHRAGAARSSSSTPATT